MVGERLNVTYMDKLAPPPPSTDEQIRTISAWGERKQQDHERAVAERDRKAAEAEQGKVHVQQAQQDVLRHALLLTGVPAAGELRLQPARPDQVIRPRPCGFPRTCARTSSS